MFESAQLAPTVLDPSAMAAVDGLCYDLFDGLVELSHEQDDNMHTSEFERLLITVENEAGRDVADRLRSHYTARTEAASILELLSKSTEALTRVAERDSSLDETMGALSNAIRANTEVVGRIVGAQELEAEALKAESAIEVRRLELEDEFKNRKLELENQLASSWLNKVWVPIATALVGLAGGGGVATYFLSGG